MKTTNKITLKGNKAVMIIGKMHRAFHRNGVADAEETHSVAKRVVAEIVEINDRGYNPVTTRGEKAISKRWAIACDVDRKWLWEMVDKMLQRHYDKRKLAMYKAAKERGIFIMG